MPESSINILDRRRLFALWPLAMLMRLWSRTIRIDAEGEEVTVLQDVSEPVIVLFWHNRLFLIPELRRRFCSDRAICGLVSASKDGAWLAAFFHLMGVQTVRGSSSRRSREAVSELAGCLARRIDVAITPDGPRGPIYSFKPGPAILGRRSGARFLLVGLTFSSAWRLKSWDRFILPRPFSRVTLRCRLLNPGALPEDFSECAEALRAELASLASDE
jgi:lysophospholipid acyltransferase (LPLAT)-like uncharacterized protein